MEKQQILGGLVILAVTGVGIGGISLLSDHPKAAEDPFAAYEELLAAAPAAELEGEGLSPSGQFRVRTVGKSETYVSGYVVPESLQIVDTETGEILWQDQGWLTQWASWSPDGRFLALAYSGRTQSGLTVVDTDTWTDWDFTLPDGSPIPEYVFFPEDWAKWLEDNTLTVTLGRGDGEARGTYRCSLQVQEDGVLSGFVLEETAEVLSAGYDFDHDGVPETTEAVTLWEPEGERTAWYELRVATADGELLWSQIAAEAHMGWTSLFALELDGQDCLLRYNPYMGQGFCTYAYEIFSLSKSGEEQVLRENRVEFDINFGSPLHQGFDAAAIAAFLEDIHGYLDQSTLLLSTDGGTYRTGGSGADFQESELGILWDESCPYDAGKSLAWNLQHYAETMTALQTA